MPLDQFNSARPGDDLGVVLFASHAVDNQRRPP